MRHKWTFIVFALFSGALWAVASSAIWNMDEALQVPSVTLSTNYTIEGMQSFFYDGIDFQGKPTQVYAYYKAPAGLPPKGGWPAVVCVHGGGGTAFYEWVQEWVDHGYAAIAMDLEGHLPDLDKKTSDRPAFDGSGPTRYGVFFDFDRPMEEQWFYQAIAQIIRAHSLIRSFPEVNPEKTGITGISWGGMLTCAVMQADERFKFAVPVYGCGFLIGSDAFMGDKLKAPGQQRAFDLFLGSSAHYDAVQMPVFFINGTNDRFFPLPSTEQTATAVRGPVQFLFPVRMAHGHKPGWIREEIYAFADSVLRGGKALPQLGNVQRNGPEITLPFKSESPVSHAELCYTKDSGSWEKCGWATVPATVHSNRMVRAEVPKETVGFFICITDSRGLTVSSHYCGGSTGEAGWHSEEKRSLVENLTMMDTE